MTFTKIQGAQKVKNPLELYFFNEINDERQKTFMSAIMHACSISRDTFYKRLKTPHKFSEIEKRFIADLIQKPVTEIFK